MKLIDTHCHPQFPQYDNDRQDMVARSFEAGVSMIAVGTDAATSRKAIELAKQYDRMWASAGLHPNESVTHEYFHGEYRDLAAHPKVVAIGEVGLDYYRTPEEESKKVQRERFEQQLQIAVEVNKPLIIHCRDAHLDMTTFIRKYQGEHEGKLRGVIHSFTGTALEAKRYIDLGFYIGLNGITTFAREYDEMLLSLPVDKILLETDAPYLTPMPYRGQRNEPTYLPEVAKVLAGLKQISLEEFALQTTRNAENLFGIKVL
jgi:TatD DNase family protein